MMPGIKEWGIYVALLVSAATAMGGTPHLTLDINTNVQPRGSAPTLLGKLGNSVYFSALTTPGAIGAGLYATDGTAAGTTQVKAIAGFGVIPNLYTSQFEYVPSPMFLTAGGKAYFTPVATTTGQEVWVTDGTAAGTHIAADVYPGQGGNPIMLGVIGANLIFFESTSDTNKQIYKTDGSAAGTVALTSFPPAVVNVSYSYSTVRRSVTVNGKVYCALGSTNGAFDLWVTDGTSAGTRQLGINVSSMLGIDPSAMTVLGNSILFIGIDPATQTTALYALDSTTDTLQVLAPAQWNGSDLDTIAVMGGYALFVGQNQLWRTDGTVGGTVAVTHISLPTNGNLPFGTQDTIITRVGNRAVFRAWGSQNALYVWSTDGTTQGTVPLIPAQDPSNIAGVPPPVVGVAGNYGYFTVSTASGDQMIATDGTVAGTHLLTGLGPSLQTTYPGSNVVAGTDSVTFLEVLESGNPAGSGTRSVYSYLPQTNTLTKLKTSDLAGVISQLLYDNGHVYFAATDPVTGEEPWISDGTVAGTHQLQNIMPESLTDDSHPASLVDFGGKVAFLADDGRNDGSIWISDGTAAGTTLLPNVTPANGVYSPAKLIGAGGSLYFFAYNEGIDSHFMRVGKPGDAPQTLADLRAPDYPVGPWSTMLNGQLYFVASKANQNALYKTDGTSAGTVALTDATPFGGPSYVYTVGNEVFFLANTSAGQQLFSTDGTSAGTVQLSHTDNAVTLSGGSALPVINGALYFSTTDVSSNVQFWKTDGTVTGTVSTASFPATNGVSDHSTPIAAVNGKLLVQRLPLNVPGYTLSVSDGTAANTTPLNTPYLCFSATVTVIRSKAYFAASNTNGGCDPWVTDGTQAGTYMLTSVADVQYSEAVWFLDFNGVTVFEVAQTDGGLLYQTDGTAGGTKLIGPIGMTPYIGVTPAVFPREHLVVGQSLFFPSVDSAAGAELFAMSNHAPVAVADTGNSDQDAAVSINVLANDTDADGSLTVSTIQITTNPAHGSVTIGTGGAVTYTPTAGYSGQDMFAYTVTDSQGAVSAPAQVTLTVTPAVTVVGGGSSNGTGSGSGSGSGGGGGGGGGGGSITYVDLAILMAFMLYLSASRLRRRSYALRENGIG
jgi:ELWxxDGT repeat protein